MTRVMRPVNPAGRMSPARRAAALISLIFTATGGFMALMVAKVTQETVVARGAQCDGTIPLPWAALPVGGVAVFLPTLVLFALLIRSAKDQGWPDGPVFPALMTFAYITALLATWALYVAWQAAPLVPSPCFG